MSELVRYGGAAPADDNCFGQYDRIYDAMKKVATILICTSPILAKGGEEYIKASLYAREYGIVKGAFSKIFKIIDDASLHLAGRQDQCTDLSDVAWGMLGMKKCNRGNAKMDGFFGLIVNFFKNHLGETGIIAALTTSNGILAVYATIRNFIATLLTNVMCAIYYNGNNGIVGTWVIAKIIIQTIGKIIKDGGVLSTNIAIGIGGEILKFVTTLGQLNKNNEYEIVNDTPEIEHVESKIAYVDNDFVVEDGGLATALSDAVDHLDNIESTKGGDKIIKEYIADKQQMADDFKDNDEKLEYMSTYLLNAIEYTEPGGEEYNEHQELLSMINQLAGRWRPATGMFDMGSPSQIAASQPMDETEYDSDYDPIDYMDETLERTRTYGGIIKKEDSKFIKNLNKSMKKMRKRLKSKKAGYNYMKKNKGTKKYRRHHNINPGFSKKKAGKKTKALGKGIKTKRRKIRRGRG
jgi:hypothetical protein